MSDPDELAVKRDRGYLVRLLAMLALAVVVSVFVFRGLTGERFGSCAADAMLGQQPTGPLNDAGSDMSRKP